DWKAVKKRNKSAPFKELLSDINGYSDEERLDLTPHLKAIKNIIVNALIEGVIDNKAPKYDRQPFLTTGWDVRKMRHAINNKGKSNGLRIIFCVNEKHILFVLIATKNDCADERKLEKVFLQRIIEYISV
ncbi:MAG: hypothetical protein ABII08_03165, partial [Candidatus Beckwithbacteria bacterium]